MIIFNRVQQFRKERKMTQDELATKVGVSRKTIVSLEKGNYTPSLLLAFQISMVMELDINQVFQVGTKELSVDE